MPDVNYPGRAGMTRPGRTRKCQHPDELQYLEMRPKRSGPFSVLVSRATPTITWNLLLDQIVSRFSHSNVVVLVRA
jgi:hypothetical protein